MYYFRFRQFSSLVRAVSRVALSGAISGAGIFGAGTFGAGIFGLTGCGNPSLTSTSASSGSTSETGTGSDPAAYVYVTDQTAGSGPNQIVAYTAQANGQLTPVPGSPFNQDVGSMAANGTFLMASANTQPDINTYTIGSNGALTLASQFNYGQDTGYRSSNDSVCGGAAGLRFDRTGQSLYAAVGNIDCSNNNAIAAFAFNSSAGGAAGPTAGSLSYLGNVNIGYGSSAAIAFLANNEFAYSAFAGIYWDVLALERSSNGNLNFDSSFTTVTPIPAPPGSTPGTIDGYTPGLTATDSANHVAMAEFPDFGMGGATPPVQLAVYTAAANGDLSTTDTYKTMPSTGVTSPLDMETSPASTLVAVGGIGGLQVFRFNGGSSMTSFTGVLTTDNISQVTWDNSNHLYAITWTPIGSTNPGRLHVFTITDSGATEAPGSPYALTNPQSIAVQSE
jgi:hypothetical protein